jgi:hypothetical protein
VQIKNQEQDEEFDIAEYLTTINWEHFAESVSIAGSQTAGIADLIIRNWKASRRMWSANAEQRIAINEHFLKI